MNDMNFFFPDSITISGHEYDCQRSKNQILVPYTEEPNVVFKKIRTLGTLGRLLNATEIVCKLQKG